MSHVRRTRSIRSSPFSSRSPDTTGVLIGIIAVSLSKPSMRVAQHISCHEAVGAGMDVLYSPCTTIMGRVHASEAGPDNVTT